VKPLNPRYEQSIKRARNLIEQVVHAHPNRIGVDAGLVDGDEVVDLIAGREIEVQILDLGGPIAGKTPFDAAARHPTRRIRRFGNDEAERRRSAVCG
jgi:hypothetical protein